MNKKIFLPLTLDNSTKTAFSGKQLFGFVAFGFLFIVFQLLVLKVWDNPAYSTKPWLLPATILTEVVAAYFTIFLIRKIVLHENKLMKNYQTNKDLQKTEIDFMWDIFAIKNSHIKYCSSGMEAVVIRLTHGYLLDRPPDQEKIHREIINTALGNLCKQGFKHIYFNREVKDPNLEPLRETQRYMIKYKDTEFYKTANHIVQHTLRVCETVANTEQEFYVIFADGMDLINRLDYAAEEFIHNLEGGVYANVEKLEDDAIWEFICSLYGLKFIDKSRLLNKMFEDNSLQLVQILEVNRASENEVPKHDTTHVPEPVFQNKLEQPNAYTNLNSSEEDDFL